jgi:hypothetical protein
MHLTRLEDIHPLTIVSMRETRKYVLLQCCADAEYVHLIQQDEDWCYATELTLQQQLTGWVNYGYGASIAEAFQDYKRRYEAAHTAAKK